MASFGLFSIREGSRYYTLLFPELGWMAADLVQYLDDILESPNREVAILKLLGMTLQISTEQPVRTGDHWVIVDLKQHQLDTNSEMIRLAIDREPPPAGSPFSQLAMQRIYQVLDRYNFTVNLYSR